MRPKILTGSIDTCTCIVTMTVVTMTSHRGLPTGFPLAAATHVTWHLTCWIYRRLSLYDNLYLAVLKQRVHIRATMTLPKQGTEHDGASALEIPLISSCALLGRRCSLTRFRWILRRKMFKRRNKR